MLTGKSEQRAGSPGARAEAILAGQKLALELAVDGADLKAVLDVLVRTIETQAQRPARASILLLDRDGVHLRHGAAPNLPPAYTRALDGLCIGANVGSCGTAAYRGQPVVTPDIHTDPNWESHRTLAAEHGLRACWSVPIFSSRGKVLGTFAVYHQEVHHPSDADREVVALISRTAGLVIERQREAEDRLEAETALRESEEKFRDLADSISQLAWMADGTGARYWYNRRWFEYTGTSFDDVKGWGWTRLHHPDHLARVEAGIRRHWASGDPWEDTFPLRGQDGQYRWFLSRALPIRDQAGQILRWFGTNTDVTQLREAEAALKVAKEQAEEANRSKDQFMAMLGHELRNPLAPLVTALRLLERRGGGFDPAAKAVIDRQIDHLGRLVDDLLDVSRIREGKVELKRATLDLGEVLARSIEMTSALIEKRSHQLVVNAAPDLKVDGDVTRLAQVMANLLANAAKYTEPGGRIEVQARRADGRVVVMVRDTGIGISAELLPTLFRPFVQADRAHERSQGGLGLGLSIVRSLVEAHGGTVTAHSDGPGRGSTFTVVIPEASGGRLTEAVAPEAPPSPQIEPGLRILVVDDNVDAAEMMAELLRDFGHDVQTVGDGAAALRAAQQFEPAVALIDIGLPTMDGYELAPRLRQSCPAASLLVAVTGYGQESDRQRSRDAGFDAHFVKPVDIDRLQDLLASRFPAPT